MSKLGDLFGKPVHGKSEADNSLPLPEAKVGIEVEVENCPIRPLINTKFWEQKEDGSLRNNGLEHVTRGGMVGQSIRDSLEELFAIAVKNKWSEGFPRAAIHIHLDVTDLDVEKHQLAQLVSNYLVVEHVLFGFAGSWRRECGFCHPFDVAQDDLDRLGKLLYNCHDKKSADSARFLSKYQSLNLNALPRFGTIEFRALPTTFITERVMTWIKLILAIKRSAVDDFFKEPLIALSHNGPYVFIERVFGPELYKEVVKFIDPAKVWEAVDIAAALMAWGTPLKSTASGWADILEPSPIIVSKLEKMKAKKIPKTKKKEEKMETGMEMLAPAAAPRRGGLEAMLAQMNQRADVGPPVRFGGIGPVGGRLGRGGAR